MKYICFLNEDTGKEELFLFPNNVHHDCANEVLCRIRNQSFGDWQRVKRVPVSAGFAGENGELYCYGNSETLHLSSRPEDTALLLQQLSLA